MGVEKIRRPIIGGFDDVRSNGIGWQDFSDTQYSQSSPFVVSANTDTILPNNGLAGPKSFGPHNARGELINLYEDGKITGRNGDGMMITMAMVVERVSNSGEFDFEHWWDIGGSVGELYRRYKRIRGSGLDRAVISTTGVYTLDTWEANGATTYVRSNVAVNIWGIRHLIHRVSPADQTK